MTFSFKLFRRGNEVDPPAQCSTKSEKTRHSTPIIGTPQTFSIQGVNVEVSEEFVPGSTTPTPSIVVRVDAAHPSRTRILGLIRGQVEKSEYSFPYPVKGEASESFDFS